MDQAFATEQSKVDRVLLCWSIGLGVLLLLSQILRWFDNTTQLSPNDDRVLQACFAISGLSGLASGLVAIRTPSKITILRRAGLAVALALLGFIAVFLTISSSANIVQGLIRFPPGKTKSYSTLLLISRAYQTHGKGRSWNIQTMPIWSNLYITEDDYEFMLMHRRVGDSSSNPDEISSNGYFCAQVTLQQSENALRVLHAGSHKLPRGTVIICPSNSDR